jgi:AhpD family alkylhydroperoxidase
LIGAGAKIGKLDGQTRESIALGAAVTLRCDGCIATHTAAALKAGASREEIAEAFSVAIALNAGAALVDSSRVMDAFEAEQQPTPSFSQLLRLIRRGTNAS